MAALDAFFGRVFTNGVEIELSKGLNFVGALSAALNETTKVIEVDVADGGVSAAMVAPISAARGVPFVWAVSFTAAAAGTADDVEVTTSAPFNMQILDRWVDITTAIGGSNVRLRSATGGGGNALSGTLDSATTCEGRRATSGSVSAANTVAEGSAIHLRRSDRGVAGTVYFLAVRT